MDKSIWACEFFKSDRFATELMGINIIIASEHYSLCKVLSSPAMCNVGGAVMGGALFSLSDFAFAVAANSENERVVSLSSSINFVAPGKVGKLSAEAKCIKDGKRTCVYEVCVKNEDGTLASVASVTGMKL